jgi:hypothetical protein
MLISFDAGVDVIGRSLFNLVLMMNKGYIQKLLICHGFYENSCNFKQMDLTIRGAHDGIEKRTGS